MKLNIDSKIELHNGISMPLFGLGTWLLNGKKVYKAVLNALRLGYRLIDSASYYGNEIEIGNALNDSEVPRDEIFITTKVWNNEQGFEKTLKAFEKSLKKLKLDYIDLYLIHWPVSGLRNETWRALETIYNNEKAHAIGVSNFTIRHLDEILGTSSSLPMVNQIEFSPFLYQKELMDYCQTKNIVMEAYSPLTRGRKFNNKTIKEISLKYKKTPAQVLIRWGLQHSIVEIPKSGNRAHLIENANVFDFNLDVNDMTQLDSLNEDFRLGADPHLIK